MGPSPTSPTTSAQVAESRPTAVASAPMARVDLTPGPEWTSIQPGISGGETCAQVNQTRPDNDHCRAVHRGTPARGPGGRSHRQPGGICRPRRVRGVLGRRAAARSRRPAGRSPTRNAAIGTFTVLAPAEGFVEAVSASKAVFGATGQRPSAGFRMRTPSRRPIRRSRPSTRVRRGPAPRRIDRRAWTRWTRSWGLAMVKSDQARAVNAGDSRVLVGILDSGIDASHPDLAGQLETALSRNFVTDIPLSRRTVRGRLLRRSRRPPTTAATAPMSRALSPRRRTASASPGWPPACGSSTSAAARTAATCSWAR